MQRSACFDVGSDEAFRHLDILGALSILNLGRSCREGVTSVHLGGAQLLILIVSGDSVEFFQLIVLRSELLPRGFDLLIEFQLLCC